MSNDIVEVVENGALQVQTRGEIDMQVATAKRYPRSIKAFRDEALSMAILDVDTAEACFYVLRRGTSTIEGPGVRLAEIVASCWGNLRVEGRIIDDDGRFVVAQGTCWDVQNNVVIRTEVRRRVTGKSGQRYSDDMIAVTGNAAISIALRNAIFRVVPSAYTHAIYEAARKVAVGDAKTLEVRRGNAFAWFSKSGASADRVLEHVGRASVEDCGLGELAILQGLRTAIMEGTTTIDQAFPAKADPAAVAPGMAGLRAVTMGKPAIAAPAESAKPVPTAAPDPAEVCPVCHRHQPDLRGQMDAISGCPECGGKK